MKPFTSVSSVLLFRRVSAGIGDFNKATIGATGTIRDRGSIKKDKTEVNPFCPL